MQKRSVSGAESHFSFLRILFSSVAWKWKVKKCDKTGGGIRRNVRNREWHVTWDKCEFFYQVTQVQKNQWTCCDTERKEKVNPSWWRRGEKKKITQHNSNLTGPLPSHIFHFMPNIFSRASRWRTSAINAKRKLLAAVNIPPVSTLRFRRHKRTSALDIQVDLVDLEQLSVRCAE